MFTAAKALTGALKNYETYLELSQMGQNDFGIPKTTW